MICNLGRVIAASALLLGAVACGSAEDVSDTTAAGAAERADNPTRPVDSKCTTPRTSKEAKGTNPYPEVSAELIYISPRNGCDEYVYRVGFRVGKEIVYRTVTRPTPHPLAKSAPSSGSESQFVDGERGTRPRGTAPSDM
jgi:hypothetical protein